MPFPPFPDLPDDDPIRSLKMFRQYVREVVGSASPYFLLASTIVAPIFLFACAWWFFGFEASLSWASDLVPLTFAVISVFVSIKTLRDEHQAVVIAFVLVLGLLGTMIMHFSRLRAESAHNSAMAQLGQKVEAVGLQNSQFLNAFLAKPPLTSQEAETERRQNIQKALRGEYILSHPNVSPGLLAGTEFPPADWMNKRLRELGEKWTVTETAATSTGTAAIPRSYVVFEGPPRFGEWKDDKGQSLPDQNLKVGQQFGFNIYYRQDGPNPVELLGTLFALYEKTDSTPTAAEQVANDFNKKMQGAPKVPKKYTVTLARGQSVFNSAFALDAAAQPRYVTQPDLDALHAGTKIVYVISQIDYSDNGKVHHARMCSWLQPPASPPPGVWHSCLGAGFGHSD